MPIRKAIPGQPISARWLNDAVERTHQNKPARSNRTDYTFGEGGAGYREADYNPLIILKVTGTTTGGYTFVEQTDPNADGTYTNADSGLSSTGTGLVLVSPSTMTLATNDLVVARRNPLNAERYEAIALLKYSSTTPALTSVITRLAANTNLTSGSTVFQNILSLVLATGTYLINFSVSAEYNAANYGDRLLTQISDGTNAYGLVAWNFIQTPGVYLIGEMSGSELLTFGSTTTVTLQVARQYAASVTTSFLHGSNVSPFTGTLLSAVKIG